MLSPNNMVTDRYRIVEFIGKGGMAKVYKALDLKLNRYVALKVLNKDYINDKAVVKKFVSEAKSAAKINHKNIVNVYDAGEVDGINFTAMELVDGITLKEFIESNGALSSKETCQIAGQICLGIEAAHKNKVIHRDIKPENVIIGDDGIIKVTDFGIARAVDGNTMEIATEGSVHYISPEQAMHGISDERSDVYSIGITMYEMVTGEVPFNAENSVTIAVSHLKNPIIPPSELNESIYPALEEIILRATKKNPDTRYQTISDMIKDLRLALKAPYEPLPALATVASTDTVMFSKEERANFDEYDFNNEESLIYNIKASKDTEVVNPNIKKVMNVLTIVGGALIALLLIFLIYKLGFSSSGAKDKVPHIVGMKLDEAKQLGEKLNFTVKVTAYDSEVKKEDEGKITKQNPESKASWNNERIINVTIAGSNDIFMSDFSGMPKAQALKQLNDMKLSVKTEEIFDPRIEEGNVVKTSPAAGEAIAKGDSVVLYVSKGKEIVNLPDVVGKAKDDAKSILEKLDFIVSFSNMDGSKDVVIKMDPSPSSNIGKGTAITLFIGNGVNKIKIPALNNMTVQEANEALHKLGLDVKEEREESSSVEAGKVIRTSPEAETEVDEKSTVTIIVAKKSRSTVPQLIGKTASDAKNILAKLGLSISVQEEWSDIGAGQIIRQSPEAGGSLEAGETVAVTISRGPKKAIEKPKDN